MRQRLFHPIHEHPYAWRHEAGMRKNDMNRNGRWLEFLQHDLELLLSHECLDLIREEAARPKSFYACADGGRSLITSERPIDGNRDRFATTGEVPDRCCGKSLEVYARELCELPWVRRSADAFQ